MPTEFVVVTNCTARKRSGVQLARLRPPPVSAGLRALAQQWRATLAEHAPAIPAGHLYVGRSISEAKAAAERLRAPLFVVSAGLGLVPADRLVPGYDLAAAGNGGGLPSLLEARGAGITDWWREISQGRGLAWLLAENPAAVVLLALPADYVRLLAAELKTLPHVDAARLRIFTSRSGRQVLAHLPHVPTMPYDERLEALTGFSGTRADFPQRALRHFVAILGAHRLAAGSAHREVESALAQHRVPEIPVRQRLTDDEVCSLIRQGWESCGGGSARLLRYLRDEVKVACEQRRFAELRRRVAVEMAG